MPLVDKIKMSFQTFVAMKTSEDYFVSHPKTVQIIGNNCMRIIPPDMVYIAIPKNTAFNFYARGKVITKARLSIEKGGGLKNESIYSGPFDDRVMIDSNVMIAPHTYLDIKISGFDISCFLMSVSGIMMIIDDLDERIRKAFHSFCGLDLWEVKSVKGEVLDEY